MTIHNPVLRGFNPDPSIVRVGEDYYIATSTFEWWPGVRIYHSTDLCHWELIGYPLTRTSQLDLRGVGPSQGVWAPDLTWDNGTFYLVYTVVRAFYCNMYDTNNYLVTAQDIRGPWSEPIPLNDFGFDPSLLHDEDGRKYIVSMSTDHRVPKKYAGRLVLQEYDWQTKKMVGPIRDIYASDTIFLEGPHIFRHNGWYYLFSADTGTGEGHGQTIQRSRSVWGPYEMYKADFMQRSEANEAWSILTSRHDPSLALQKAGHADLVETPGGEWYIVHLCGRPGAGRNPDDAPRFAGMRRYMLGRETAIQKVCWTPDGWLRLTDGGTEPQTDVPAPADAKPMLMSRPFARDDFDAPILDPEYQSLRVPMDGEYISLTARPGWLRMYGHSGLASRFSQALIARRLTEYRMQCGCRLEFEPEYFKQMAGLILYYDTDNYLYFHLSYDEDVGKCVTLLKAENKRYQYLTDFVPIPPSRAVTLQLTLDGAAVHFRYQVEGEPEHLLATVEDASFLSDEACIEGWFTGTMCGICCQDLSGQRKSADFDWFEVQVAEP